MPISFNSVPNNIRAPGSYFELDNSQAFGAGNITHKVLLVGQLLSTGSKSDGDLDRVTSLADALQFYGEGSHLASIYEYFSKNSQTSEVYCLAVEDLPGGVQATATVAITGTATVSGTLYVYVCGRRLAIGVTSGDTASQVATALNTAINAESNLLVTSTVSTATVTLTSRHKGEWSNDLDVRVNYGNEKNPAGITTTVTNFSGGTGNPDLTTDLANLPEVRYDFYCFPYNDATNLDAIGAHLTERWGPWKALHAMAFYAKKGTVGTLNTFGDLENSEWLCCMGYNDSPTPSHLWAAALTGVVAQSGWNDPALPFEGRVLNGVLPPPESSLFQSLMRNGLLFDGVSTFTVNGGRVEVDRLITNYQKRNGVEDTSYLNVNRVLTNARILIQFQNVKNRYKGHKLADDNAVINPATQKTVTPEIIKQAFVSEYRLMAELLWVEDVPGFASSLIVERNINDPDRIDVQCFPRLVNQFYVIALKQSFVL